MRRQLADTIIDKNQMLELCDEALQQSQQKYFNNQVQVTWKQIKCQQRDNVSSVQECIQ